MSRNMDRILGTLMLFILSFTLAFAANYNNHDTFAGNEEGIYEQSEEYFVTFYDEDEKLTVRTDAKTVAEALEQVGIEVAKTDIVEPGLNTEIASDYFFINIHRSRPVVVKDGKLERYVMTASYDPKTIAREAGLTIYDGDEVKMATLQNFLETGAASMYEVVRNGGRTVTEEVDVQFDEETVKDYNLEPGQMVVRQLGEMGLKVRTYEVYYDNNVEVKRELVTEEVKREPVTRIVAVGASPIERNPLTAAMGRNRYTVRRSDGIMIERQETYYDLNMSGVMQLFASECGVEPYYTVREDGVKVDAEGYVMVAADLDRYPRCSVVETSLGRGKVYDTGTFVISNPEQFDIATDWTNRDGK